MSPSFDPEVPVLLVAVAALVLVVGAVWTIASTTVSTLRTWLG